jgi:hypothetical protein
MPAIKKSHVISALVYRAIKSDSPTGYFRNPNNPNRRFQDGDKTALLCRDCETRFGDAERQFNDQLFSDFHHHDCDTFDYGPWLHYFMTSIAWRTLVLDLPGLEADAENPPAIVAKLSEMEELMRDYLLGNNRIGRCISNHAVAWTKGDSASRSLAAIGPNVLIRRSVFGYMILDRRRGYAGILHNLAGFMCFCIAKGKPTDVWRRTRIAPEGGRIAPPQVVNSWLMGELLNCIVEAATIRRALSDRQRDKVLSSVDENAAALRFREVDKQIKVND